MTSSATLLGFALGSLLGAVLAVAIVQMPTLGRAVFPWIIASQTIPGARHRAHHHRHPRPLRHHRRLAQGGDLDVPVLLSGRRRDGQGLRSPGVFERELMHTYAASPRQTFWKLRLPASLPFLFPSLRVAIAAGLVGAIVGELPTGAQAGLGARLLTGSYYGNTVQIWSALVMAALLGLALTAAVSLAERALVAGGKR